MYNYYVPFLDDNMAEMNHNDKPRNMSIESNINFMSGQNQEFFDPFNGLMKGNMFPRTFLPYRNYANFPIKPINERQQLMSEIQAYGFALTDLNLYLDLHKDDKQALGLYRRYLNEYKNAKNNYENKYGPINITSNVLGNYPWSWVEGPWPWERG